MRTVMLLLATSATILRCGGELDTSVSKTVLATNVNVMSNIAVDETNVYWGSTDNGGTVYECAIGGCQAPTALASMQGNPVAVAVDPTNVYWTNDTTNGTVMACAIAGCNGNPTVLASGQTNPTSITVAGSNVYWTNEGTSSDDGAVMTCSVSGCGGNPTTFASKQSVPSSIAVDSANVYWSSHGNQVVRCAIAGCSGNPELLVSHDYVADFAIEGETLYWAPANEPGQAVMSCAVSGCGGTGSPFESLPSGANVASMAVDDTAVYWASYFVADSGEYTTTVSKCALAGCAGATTLWSEKGGFVSAISPMTVDATRLYVVIAGDLVALAPK